MIAKWICDLLYQLLLDLKIVTIMFSHSELRVHGNRFVCDSQDVCAPIFRSALPPIGEPISSTFLGAQRGNILEIVKFIYLDPSRHVSQLLGFRCIRHSVLRIMPCKTSDNNSKRSCLNMPYTTYDKIKISSIFLIYHWSDKMCKNHDLGPFLQQFLIL